MWKILLALLQHKYNKFPTNMWYKIPRRYGRRIFPPQIENGVLCISYKDKDNQLRFYPVQDGNVLATLKQIDKDLHAQFRCYFPHV